MAPKGTKRTSTCAIERAAKKAAVSKCAAVVAELGKVEALPERCKAMLVSIAEPALATYATERHEFQVQGVDMVAKALAMVEAALERNVSQEQVKVDSSDAEKADRAAAFSLAETKVAELQQAATNAKATFEAHTLSEHAAKIDVTKAREILKEKSCELANDVEKGKRLEDAKTLYEPLKTAKLSGHEGRKTLHTITKVLKEFELEDLIVATIGEALHKEVHERGTFDSIIVEQVDKKLSEWIIVVDSSIKSGDSVKGELTTAQTAAEQHHAALSEKLAASKIDVQVANTAVSEGKMTFKDAEVAVKSFEKDTIAARKKLEEAKAALESFKGGALKTFSELKDFAPPALPTPEEKGVPTSQEIDEFKALD